MQLKYIYMYHQLIHYVVNVTNCMQQSYMYMIKILCYVVYNYYHTVLKSLDVFINCSVHGFEITLQL